LLRLPDQSKHEMTTASAKVTLGCMDTVPGGATNSRPIVSPTSRASIHQVSAQARTPRSCHVLAYSASASPVAAGMAPKELEIR